MADPRVAEKAMFDARVDKLEKQFKEMTDKVQHLYGVHTPPYLEQALVACQDGLYKLQNDLKQLVGKMNKFMTERFVEVLTLDEVKALVKSSGINQKQLADALTTDITVVSRILSGEKHKDSLPVYNKIKMACVKYAQGAA